MENQTPTSSQSSSASPAQTSPATPPKKTMFSLTQKILLSAAAIIFLLGIIAFFTPKQQPAPDGQSATPTVNMPESPTETEQITCTAEAKICPDGSSVGRVPPRCEFAPCPGL